MLKTKPLRPAHREKKRYVVYEVSADQPLNMYSVQKDIIDQIHSLLGVFLSSTAGVMPLKFDTDSMRGILRVNHTAVDYIKSCFVLIKSIQDHPVSIKSLGVSGIMKKAKENFFQAQK